jgi:type IV secretory pathway TrbF-like protein
MNPFKGSPRLGVTPAPETPYQKYGQAFDLGIGAAKAQAANWRRMALGLLGLSAGLAGGLVWLAVQGTVTPWIVQVDRQGEIQAVGPAVRGYAPTDDQVRSALGRLIKDVRSISSDGVMVSQAWDQAYAMVDGDAARFITDYANAIDLKSQVGKAQVAVEVTSVLRASPKSFRAAWIERRYVNGQLAATERWSAILTVELRRPRTDREILANALGVRVTALTWTRELGA